MSGERRGSGASAGAARLARSTLANLTEVTDRLVAEIISENPKYSGPTLVPEPDLRESCRANVERVLQLLGRCVPEGADPYDAARETGRRRARQRAPLDLVLRSFRLGGRVVWSSALEAARAGGDGEPELLLEAATSVWMVVDEVSSVVSDTYRSAELELLRADERRRGVLIDELLHGGAAAESAVRALGLPEFGGYAAVAAAQDPPDPVALEESLALGGFRSVWQARSGTVLGVVALEGRPEHDAAAALRAASTGRVGVSPVVVQAARLPDSRELALLALRTIPSGTTGTVALDERLPQALLARSPELADRLIERALGPLLALPDGERDVLLATLRAWLDSDRSAKLAAGRLFCHRNTVQNRLVRIESLLARSIHGVDDAIELALALHARDLRAERTPVLGAQRAPANGGPAT